MTILFYFCAIAPMDLYLKNKLYQHNSLFKIHMAWALLNVMMKMDLENQSMFQNRISAQRIKRGLQLGRSAMINKDGLIEIERLSLK
jgi:hypothetical protein